MLCRLLADDDNDRSVTLHQAPPHGLHLLIWLSHSQRARSRATITAQEQKKARQLIHRAQPREKAKTDQWTLTSCEISSSGRREKARHPRVAALLQGGLPFFSVCKPSSSFSSSFKPHCGGDRMRRTCGLGSRPGTAAQPVYPLGAVPTLERRRGIAPRTSCRQSGLPRSHAEPRYT